MVYSDLNSAGIDIRAATAEDLPALIRVGDRLFDYPLQPDCATEFFTDPRHHLAIAVREHQIVGFASAFHYVHLDKQAKLFINEVSVLSEYRNIGVANGLLIFLQHLAGQLNCICTWLITEQTNTAARKAYASAGGIEDKSVSLYSFTSD
ncbi:GNAT family N-acetyltransferase [Neptunicella sp. SCSIO 80796]|uniref:GNAT family N-acetyltransferase n=1 Tax=Neptunicella plasticusilytica TaxID=3117012 RepID=UPI003A4DC78E